MQKSENTDKKILGLTKQEIILIFVSMLWGGTFIIVKYGLSFGGPFYFVGMRFLSAALFAVLLSFKILKGFSLREIMAGSVIGVCIFFGYSLQTVGLQTIASSKSAFITALYVPIVPVLQWVILKRMPGLMSWVGVAFAFAGLVFLAGPESGDFSIGFGEFLTILSAAAIAGEVVLISRFAGTVDIRRITIVQLIVACILSFCAMPLAGEEIPDFSWIFFAVTFGLGFMSAFVQLMMNWAQKSVSPTRATLIYAGEPVWAGVIGRIAGERLPAQALTGAVLVLAGVIVSELKLKIRKRIKAEPN